MRLERFLAVRPLQATPQASIVGVWSAQVLPQIHRPEKRLKAEESARRRGLGEPAPRLVC